MTLIYPDLPVFCGPNRHFLIPTKPPKFSFLKQLSFVILILALTAGSAFSQMRKIYLGLSENAHINSISFITPSTGFVAIGRNIGFTTDSGRTYTQRYITWSNVDYGNYSVNLTFGFSIAGIKAFSDQVLVAYGDYGFVPAIIRSTDGGQTWKLVFHSQTNPMELTGGITDMNFPQNGPNGFAVDADRILKTTNQGQSWSVIRLDPGSYFTHIQSIDLSNLVVYSRYSRPGKLLKSGNGGNTWQTVSTPSASIGSAFFLTAQKGWLTDYPAIYYTSNGGTNWTLKNDVDVTPEPVSDMRFFNDSTGYGISGFYNLYKTTDSGKVWQPLPRDNNYEYLGYSHFALHFYSENIFWAGGGHGFLEITTNSGGIPKPTPFFKIDTAGLHLTQMVKLVNYSKPNYQYSWYKNDTLISQSYHTSFTHNLSIGIDRIKLIVSDGTSKDSLTLNQLYVVPVPPVYQPYSGWVTIPTGIADNLRDVKMKGNYGVLIGDKGVYYTTEGIENTSNWKKYAIGTSGSDSLLFARTKFFQAANNGRTNQFFFCGNDTVNNKAVLLRLDLSNMQHQFIYQGEAGSRFNGMVITRPSSYTDHWLIAVGDKGLYVSVFPQTNAVKAGYLADHRDLKDVYLRDGFTSQGDIGIVSDSVLYIGHGIDVFNPQMTRRLKGQAKAGATSGITELVISDKRVYRDYYSDAVNYGNDSIMRFKALYTLTYNAIKNAGGNQHKFVATDHGIFKITSQNNSYTANDGYMEYQPTSEGKFVNNLWFGVVDEVQNGYAVGPDGLLMKTTNFGGPAVPYSEINTSGGCLNEQLNIAGFNGSGTKCSWFMNDAPLNNTCGSFSLQMNTAGTFRLKYIVSNVYGMADTSTRIVEIKAPPMVNLPTIFDDTIICKVARLQVSMQGSQTGFRYDLVSDATKKVVGGAVGNGNMINFKTDSISTSGYFFIRAADLNQGCSKDFTTKTMIRVEKTRSAFNADRINIATGEPVKFFQHSEEATTFKWLLPADASSSLIEQPMTGAVTFSSPGQKQLTLISSSQDGCTDTLTANSVYVYAKPASPESCYLLPVNDSNVYTQYEPLAYINRISLHRNNGYIISGGGYDVKMRSRYGISKELKGGWNAYVAKYTADGVLSWINYLLKDGSIKGTATDANGNVYVVGDLSRSGSFMLSNGDQVKLTNVPTLAYTDFRNGFILKLDSNGHYLWHTVIADPASIAENGFFPFGAGSRAQVFIRDNNIVVTGRFHSRLAYHHNNIEQQLVSLPGNTYPNYVDNTYVLKINDDGSLAWHAYFEGTMLNMSNLIAGVDFDAQGNSYIAGSYEETTKFHDVGSVTNLTMNGYTAYRSSYLIKLDASGRYKWKSNTDGAGDVHFQHLKTDQQGNSYIAGVSGSFYASNGFPFYSSDQSMTRIQAGQVLVMKVSADGKFVWANGSQYSYYGGAYSIFLKNDRLYTLATQRNNGITEDIFTMTSTDSNNITMPYLQGELFITTYDTAGRLKGIAKSDASSLDLPDPRDLIMDNEGNFIFSSGIQEFLDTPVPVFYGISLPPTGRQSTFFGKLKSTFCLNNTIIPANAGSDKTICASDSVVIGTPAVSGANYYWHSEPAGFISGAANPKVKPGVTTTYYLDVINPIGLISRDTVKVTALPNPIANAGKDSVICTGTSITLGTAAIAGNTYQWTSQPAGSNSTDALFTVTPSQTSTFYLSVSNTNGCSMKDTVVVTPRASLTPSVTIVRSNVSACAGTMITYTAVPVNGGPTPNFQWTLNNVNAGSDSIQFSGRFAHFDVLKVKMTSSLVCASPPAVTSNTATVNSIALNTPVVNITTPSTSVCAGSSVTFTATQSYGGFPPIYQWKKNGLNVGQETSAYTDNSLVTGDKISVVMTSRIECVYPREVTSNVITMSVFQPQTMSVTIAGNTTVMPGEATELTATSINVSELPNFQWYDSTDASSWKPISGATLPKLTYVASKSGVKVRTRISGYVCSGSYQAYSNTLVFTVNVTTGTGVVPASSFAIKAYPNPVVSVLTIDSLRLADKWQTLDLISADAKAYITNMQIHNKQTVSLDVNNLPVGVYIAILRRESGTAVYLRILKL